MKPLELTNWADEFPSESPLQIAIRQSTVCLCGKPKQIGEADCGCGKSAPASF